MIMQAIKSDNNHQKQKMDAYYGTLNKGLSSENFIIVKGHRLHKIRIHQITSG